MTERPIIFNEAMVRAILEGRKTQTRRVMEVAPPGGMREKVNLSKGPYGQPGDRLWVRTDFYLERPTVGTDNEKIWCPYTRTVVWKIYDESYAGDHHPMISDCKPGDLEQLWDHKPSIHMPRWASRITLEITDVRVERLREIHHKESELEAEGVLIPPTELYPHTNRADKLERQFVKLWHTIHAEDGPKGWNANPWVWVIEFKRIEQGILKTKGESGK